jgi:tripeptide aminopeptidase
MTPTRDSSQVQLSLQQEIARISTLPEVRAALAWLRIQEPQFARWQLEMARIPAPPFGETARGAWLRERFRELGLGDLGTDEVGNVFGARSGTGRRWVSLSAHLDTVFPAGTPLAAHQQGSKLFGPGVSDNGAGVTAMLAVAAALAATSVSHALPILFIGNVGEEGEGDLRGMRQIFSSSRWQDSIVASLVLDGAGSDTVVAQALGSRRFEVTVRGPGGHSWSDFGAPNPILLLARAIRAFSQTPVPSLPKNVGVIQGGTAVNSIPQLASMRVDIRSASMAEIDRLEAALRQSLAGALQEESQAAAARGSTPRGALALEVAVIGNRPAGELHPDAHILQVIRAVDAHLGNAAQIQRASTDANIPLSLGREAIAIGGGGTGGGAHTLEEWFDCAGREFGLKRILLTVLALASA